MSGGSVGTAELAERTPPSVLATPEFTQHVSQPMPSRFGRIAAPRSPRAVTTIGLSTRRAQLITATLCEDCGSAAAFYSRPPVISDVFVTVAAGQTRRL